MDFLARLRRYLERVGQASEGLPYVSIDMAAHKQFLLKMIEGRAAADSKAAYLAEHGSKLDDPFEVFVQWLAAGILDEINPKASPSELANLINSGIESYLGGPSSELVRPGASQVVLRQIAERAWLICEMLPLEFWQIPNNYAFEVRLVHRRGESVQLSRCGKTLLEMPGMDGVRWLLALETAQSMGITDEFRLSPELAAYIAAHPRDFAHREDSRKPHEAPWRANLPTMRRLAAFELLTFFMETDSDTEYPLGYEINERHLSIFNEIARPKSTPYAILADALLRDETNALVARAHPNATGMIQESAAATVAIQARMVVHEIRNALLPAQIAFDSIATNLAEDNEALQKKRRRIDGGLKRALDFVDDMLRVANLGVEESTNFDVAAALREACASMARDLNGGFRQEIEVKEATISGPRVRFILAIRNLLRNAAQSITNVSPGRIVISTEFDGANVLIHVDDNGPGVPMAHRSAIFEPGVSLRSGGSGQGLALVRQVVEGEMQGKVTCTDGPVGGARFSLCIPMQSRSK